MKRIKTKMLTLLFVLGAFISVFPNRINADTSESKQYFISGYLLNPSQFEVVHTVARTAEKKAIEDLTTWEKEALEISEPIGVPFLLAWPSVAYANNNGLTEADEVLVNYIPSTISSELTKAIQFVRENGNFSSTEDKDFISGKNVDVERFNALVNSVATFSTAGSGGCTFSPGADPSPYGIKISDFESGAARGLKKENLVEITCGSEKGIFIYNLPKGYGPDEYGKVAWDRKYPTSTMLEYASDGVSWKEVAKVASYLYTNRGWTAPQNISNIGLSGGVESDLTNSLVDAIGNFINTCTSFLGIDSMDSVIFNSGSRGTTYYYGTMPKNWYNNLRIFYWIATIVAAFIMTFSFLKMVIKKETSVISPGEKYSFMDGILDYIYAFMLLLLFPLLFYVLLNINSSLVSLFRDMSQGRSLVSTLSFGRSISGVILQFILLFVTVKINIEYLIRAITIAVCYAIAPAMIASLTFTGRRNSLMSRWLKELLVNLFIQTFNAIMLAFYIIVTQGNGKLFIAMVLAYSFLPLNKWFKNNLLGQSGVGGDAAASETQQGAAGGYAKMAGAAIVGGLGVSKLGGSTASMGNRILANAATKPNENQTPSTDVLNSSDYRDNNSLENGKLSKSIDDYRNFRETYNRGKYGEGALSTAGGAALSVVGNVTRIAGKGLSYGGMIMQAFDNDPQSALKSAFYTKEQLAKSKGNTLAYYQGKEPGKDGKYYNNPNTQQKPPVPGQEMRKTYDGTMNVEDTREAERQLSKRNLDNVRQGVASTTNKGEKRDIVAKGFENRNYTIPTTERLKGEENRTVADMNVGEERTITPVVEGLTDEQAKFINKETGGGEPLLQKDSEGNWRQEINLKKNGDGEIVARTPMIDPNKVQKAMDADIKTKPTPSEQTSSPTKQSTSQKRNQGNNQNSRPQKKTTSPKKNSKKPNNKQTEKTGKKNNGTKKK